MKRVMLLVGHFWICHRIKVRMLMRVLLKLKYRVVRTLTSQTLLVAARRKWHLKPNLRRKLRRAISHNVAKMKEKKKIRKNGTRSLNATNG